MPSNRRQLNIRLSPETEKLLAGLVERMRAVLGIPVSQADVIQAGLHELAKKYLADDAAEAPAPKKQPRKGKAGPHA
jgi:predicted DNA-binding protein